jgi:hypothetical protein
MGICFCAQRNRNQRNPLELHEQSQRNYRSWLASRLPEEYLLLEPYLETAIAEYLRYQLLQGSTYHLQYIRSLLEQTIQAYQAFEESTKYGR